MKNKIDLRRYTVAIVTMAIVAALLSFYFMFYVSKNDREIRERNFRVLNRTVSNIKMRAVDYQKYFSSVSSVIADSLIGLKPDTFIHMARRIEKRIGNKADAIIVEGEKTSPKNLKSISLDNEVDSAFLKIKIDTSSAKIPRAIVYSVTVSKFLTPILRDDAFEHYLLIKDTDILYKNFPQEFTISKFDSLFKKSARFKTNSIITAEFAGRNYTLFVSPFEFSGQNNFALVGVVPSEKINAEKYAVPGSFIIVVLSVIFFVLLSLPLIKTILMSENERLKITDVLSSFLCFMLGFALLLYIFIHLFAGNFIDNERYDSQQTALASSIKNSFRNDLLSTYRQLAFYDSLATRFPCNITNINQDSLSQSECKFICVSSSSDRSILQPKISSSFKSVFWLDNEADEIVRWTTDSKLPGKTNYKERNYFQQIKNRITWQLPDTTRASFVMQPVFTWTDGRFRAIVAMETSRKILVDSVRHDSATAILSGISAWFPSVINTVLPAGYSYCIINNEGEIWFDSDTRKNLNENFIHECSSYMQTAAAMNSQKPEFIDARYSGINSRIYISPVEGLPLFLAIIRNTETESTKNVQSFLITMGLSLSLVLVFVLLLNVFILLRMRHSKLKRSFLQVSWLFPSEESSEYYRMTIFLNVLVTIISYFVTSAEHPFFTFYVFVANVIVSLASFYFMGIKESPWYFRRNDRRNFYAVMTVVVFLLLSSAWNNLTDRFFIYYILYVIYCFVSAFLLFSKDNPFSSFIKETVKKVIRGDISYKKVYSLMIFWWLMHTIFLPVMRFYQIADNYESKNLLKYEQLNTALQVNKLLNVSDVVRDTMVNNVRDSIHNIYLNEGSTLFFSNSSGNKKPACNREEGTLEKQQFTGIIKAFHVMFSKAAADQEELFSEEARDTSMQWTADKKNLCFKFTGKIKKTNTADTFFLSSALPATVNPLIPFSGEFIANLGYLLLLFLLTKLLYNCVHFFVNKFFLINYFEIKKLEHLNPLFIDESDLKLEENTKSKMVLISLPNSGKRNYLKKIIKATGLENNRVDIDLAQIDTAEWTGEKSKASKIISGTILILHHFEHKISEPAVNVKKLDFIESLFRKELQHIILLTTIHPRAFLSMMKKDASASDISDITSENNYYRWALLFSSFKIIYYPVVKDLRLQGKEIADISGLIEHECSYGDFLKRLQPNLISYAQDERIRELSPDALAEEIILMIQHQAEAYYLSVWHSLTRDEQYVLYDIAEDELSNYKNREALTMLFNKGLLVHEGRLKIMNLSFRNFILTVVKPESKITNDMERAKGSNFNKFKVPFFIIFIATMFFIFYTQEETFNKFIAIVASFTASLPLVLRLFSIIPGTGAKGIKTE